MDEFEKVHFRADFKFDDSNINFSVVIKAVNRGAHFVLKHHFIKAIHKRFQNGVIVIEFPVRRLYFKDNTSSGMLDQNRSR